MKSNVFRLLANEGSLLQGCFKTALRALRTANSGDASLFYAVSFNYVVGLERLLKVILILDCWNFERRFPTDAELKQHGGKTGHDLKILFESVKKLFLKYKVTQDQHSDPDGLDEKVLTFLSEFARASRYFNLDTLGGSSRSADPLEKWARLIDEIYITAIPEGKRINNELEVAAFVRTIEDCVSDMGSTSLNGEPQSYMESSQEHEKTMLVIPEICWRLVRMLVPLKRLLIALRTTAHENEGPLDDETSIPFMEEFLDFVCSDKEIVLNSQDWP